MLAGTGRGLVVGFVMENIIADTCPWVIYGILQNFGGTRKNMRRRKQTIRNYETRFGFLGCPSFVVKDVILQFLILK